ncbi:MAG: hypothetical protein K2N85_04180 [Lachnospiraceae bacterium]|nr:hypothetical protein [Lachnospiraceae bacterium]
MEINFDETLEHGSKEDLNKLKSWLFRENVRIITASKDLENTQRQFIQEKEQFQNEMKALNRKLSGERKKLEQDKGLFEKQMQILKNGFDQLDIDRRRLQKERAKLEAQKEIMNQSSYEISYGEVSVFFKGVNSLLALKKRYKDLIKIFHPDNVAGDKEIIQMINSEYENLKRRFDTEKRA